MAGTLSFLQAALMALMASAPPWRPEERPTSRMGMHRDKTDGFHVMEVQLPVGKGHLSNGCCCHAEIQGGLSCHTCLLQALSCVPFPLSSYEDRFLPQLKHKATLSGGAGTVTEVR